ncbi:hypothetical protein Patl1_36688 [Pistacia atlantica]|nr:hypothetical protein Patl1_36688 [Pistacia atlantica]
MALLHQACEKWDFFQVKNHGIDKQLIEKVKQLVNSHYEYNLKEGFYESEMAKRLNSKDNLNDTYWETAHHPKSNINEITNLLEDLRLVTMNQSS